MRLSPAPSRTLPVPPPPPSRAVGTNQRTIDEALIRRAVALDTRSDEEFMAESLQVVPAFDTPHYAYDATRRAYDWCVYACVRAACARAPTHATWRSATRQHVS